MDVGSFLGIYAVLEARFAGPRGRVVALEPTAWSASVARSHFAFNADPAAAPIVLLEAAAGDERREQAAFYEYDEPYVNALAPAVDVAGRALTRTVEVVTIDDVCDRLKIRPTFIRMDVQGAEFQALRRRTPHDRQRRCAPDDRRGNASAMLAVIRHATRRRRARDH